MRYQAEVLFPGEAEGQVLRLDEPVSFWGGVDPETSKIVLADHPQRGMAIRDTILVIPQMIGSSSSSAIMLELIYKSSAPRALILGKADAILPLGVVAADQMGWATCPVLVLADLPFRTGDQMRIFKDGGVECGD